MDKWKIQLVLVTFCALVQIYQSSSVDKEGGLSEDWQTLFSSLLQEKNKTKGDESAEAGLQLSRLMKRAKALRFYGLMGKRSGGAKKPFQEKKRNKGEMFVGLMGRSIPGENSLSPSATTAAPDVLEKPHKQGSSEEWFKILY